MTATETVRDGVSLPRLVAGSALAFGLLTVAVAGRFAPLIRFDAWVSRAAHSVALAHPLWRSIMAAVTFTGGTVFIWPVTAAGCVLLLAYGRRRQALFAALAMIVTIEARLIVVAAVARPRPVDRLAAASNYSFPSGHSTASTAAALVLVVVCGPMLKRRWQRVVLAAVAGGWAVAVGASRVALVVHWPSDVLGAWLFTLTTVPAVGWALRRIMTERR